MQTETVFSSEYKKNMGKPEAVSADRPGKKTGYRHRFIYADSDIPGEKPVLKEICLSADFIPHLFPTDRIFRKISESCPCFSPEAVQAVFVCADECLSEESLFRQSRHTQ
ncbi:MAG: hypothetical protein AB7S75_08110 [Desulfococcaceae bacterium]